MARLGVQISSNLDASSSVALTAALVRPTLLVTDFVDFQLVKV